MNPDALRTLKVDPETMETLAQKSKTALGPPVSVTRDDEDDATRRLTHEESRALAAFSVGERSPPPRAWAGLICLIIAFGTGAFFGRPEHQAPPLPRPPQHAPPAPVVLAPLELPPPRSEPPREIQKLTRTKHRPDVLVDPWKKPLFERKN